MHPAIKALLARLSFGNEVVSGMKKKESDTVGKLAQVYEIARNAIEYRADHLVRRAAIERILKRQMVFTKNAKVLAEELITELKWARYVTPGELDRLTGEELEGILGKYMNYLAATPGNWEWVMGVISAEIEEKINLNSDYHKFTNFVFHAIKRKIVLEGMANLDLLLYVAVDRAYSLSDEQQVSYHLMKLIAVQAGDEEKKDYSKLLTETWKYYQAAMKNPQLGVLIRFTRKNMSPLVLVRDMYFANPARFRTVFEDESEFRIYAQEVLTDQLKKMSGRMKRATVRSLIYVFLTKMIFGMLIEIPAEKIFGGQANYFTLAINMLIPVVMMWILTVYMKLPDEEEQQKLVDATAEIAFNFDVVPRRDELLTEKIRVSRARNGLFTIFYGLLFILSFSLLILLLSWLKFSVVSSIIFLFFLCVISFFAYRIRQTSEAYGYEPEQKTRTQFSDILMLPIVVAGGWLSTGVSKLNFMVFIFDFVLEAPFKIILRFLDNWSQFLSLKRDEVVG